MGEVLLLLLRWLPVAFWLSMLVQRKAHAAFENCVLGFKRLSGLLGKIVEGRLPRFSYFVPLELIILNALFSIKALIIQDLYFWQVT